MAVSLIQVASADVAFRRSCEFCGLTFRKQPALRLSGLKDDSKIDGDTVYIHRHCAAMVLESVFEAQKTRAQRARENMAQIAALGGVASEGHERHIASGKLDPASCHDCAMLQEEPENAEDWSGTR